QSCGSRLPAALPGDPAAELLGRAAPVELSFDQDEQALSPAHLLPLAPDRALAVGIGKFRREVTLVFDDEKPTILQLGDEIGIEEAGRRRQPERGGMAGDVAEPEAHLAQAVDRLRTGKL